MGAEQSGPDSTGASSSSSASLLERVKSVGTPRLARTEKIVVVSAGVEKQQFDVNQDENVIKMQVREILWYYSFNFYLFIVFRQKYSFN